MGFGDKLKGLKDQAQQAVVDNKDKIQGAVQTAAEVANVKTGGKYADKISNVGTKLSASVDKLADDPSAATTAPGSGAAGGDVAAEPAPQTTAPSTEEAPTPAPSGAPPEFE